MLAAAVSANLMLDLLFVAGFFMGIAGAAVATAISYITLRVILSWIFIGTYQLKAVAAATGIGWVLVNLFWSVLLIHKNLLPKYPAPHDTPHTPHS